MALIDYFKKKTVTKDEEINVSEKIEIKGVKKKTQNPVTLKQVKDFMVKAVGSINLAFYDRERFERPEYNLWEIKEASEADSYIKIALTKYSNLIYKAGYSLKGEDKKVDYLNKRFRIMSFATQKPVDILFQEVSTDLLTYSNAFLVKRRVDNVPGLDLKPVLADKVVGGYFRMDPASIKIKRDKSGNVLKYEQGYGSNKKQFFPRDVIHFYLDKDANNAFGTPRIIAALEDVKLLRKIEGNVSALIYRFSMPVYQWKIGLPQPGYEAGDTEIGDAKREIEGATLDSIVVTSERVEIKGIGAEGTALNAEGYLKYFEQRTFSALGVSDAQMGRGGSKQDADSMESQVHDTVKHVQRTMSIFIREYILSELLLEGGYNPILNDKDIVEYEFDEISLDTKVKTENHEMLKWQSNFSSLSESRRKLGMKDSPSKGDLMYKEEIETKARLTELDRTKENQIEIINIQAKIAEKAMKKQSELDKANQINQPNKSQSNKPQSSSKTKNTTGNSKPRSSKKTEPNKDVSTKNRPKNQHGETSVKIKENLVYNAESSIEGILATYKDEIKNSYFGNVSYIIKEKLRKEVEENKINGLNAGREEIKTNYMVDKLIYEDDVYISKHNYLYEEINQFVDEVFAIINNAENVEFFDSIFDATLATFTMFEEKVIKKAYWIAFLFAAEELDSEINAYIIYNDENNNSSIINPKNYNLNDIPPFNENYLCYLTYNKQEVGES